MSNERWKPENGDFYYTIVGRGKVTDATWEDDEYDREYYEYGNCFETEEEAEAAAEKVKALLTSLHEPVTNCNQLPKLTVEVFDCPDCPEWTKYAAVDRDGAARYHERYPRLSKDWWFSSGNIESVSRGKFDTTDWQNSLIERPTKQSELPDWCKFDAIGWHKRAGYFKVCADDELARRISIQQLDDKSRGWLSYETLHTEVMQARLRPYNEDEMRGLVGVVICKGRSVHFVTGYEDVFDDEGMVHVNGCLYSANDLLHKGFTYDSRPCGRLEHLDENGEWVR